MGLKCRVIDQVINFRIKDELTSFVLACSCLIEDDDKENIIIYFYDFLYLSSHSNRIGRFDTMIFIF